MMGRKQKYRDTQRACAAPGASRKVKSGGGRPGRPKGPAPDGPDSVKKVVEAILKKTGQQLKKGSDPKSLGDYARLLESYLKLIEVTEKRNPQQSPEDIYAHGMQGSYEEMAAASEDENLPDDPE